jgi:PAS domain S-box-containing protein
MEGNYQQEPASDPILLQTPNRQAKGILDVRELLAANAKLVTENERLASERDLLRTIIDNLPDPIYVKDTESRFLMGNSACARTLGASRPDEIANKTDFDFFPKDSAERYLADEQAVMRSGQTLNTIESICENGTKESRWRQTTKVARRDGDGNIIGLIGIGRDITELKRAKEASNDELQKRTIQLSRERLLLRTLIDNLPDSIYAKDSAGRKTLANPADLKNLRCKTEDDAIGKNDFDFFPREIAEKFWADDQKVIQGQPVINREESFLDEAGCQRWLLTSKLPLRDADDKIIGLVGIGRDITLEKQMRSELAYEQQLLQALLENSPTRIFFKDIQSRFVRFSHSKAQGTLESMRKTWCIEHPKAPLNDWPSYLADIHSFSKWLIGKTDFDTYPDAIARVVHKDEQEILRTGLPVINKLESAESADGQVYWWLVTKLPWRDKDGNIIGTFGASQDVTPLKQAEESLRQFATQLERSNRELQDFAYVASHDLQEPLRKIVVFGERLQEKAAERLEPETLDYLQRMRKAASRMQSLINDLLAFSRVTTKAQPFAPVDLAQTAREVIEDLEGRIEQTKGRVEQGELPVIDAEPLQMRQLLQNLLGNALKFRRPEVSPVVKIESKVFSGVLPNAPPDSAHQQLCELTVSDNGIGFDEKYLDRIFNVFQRLHTQNEYEGTGMGLAITRKIVLLHGGFITARSTPGQGAAFIATLPVTHPKSSRTEINL